MRSLPTSAETAQPPAQSFPAHDPCNEFALWATHPDERIAKAGANLRAKWCREALAHPQLLPLVAFIKHAWREHWPDGATAGAAWYDLAQLARYLHSLEAHIVELEGGTHE